jgi:hypothetical protein
MLFEGVKVVFIFPYDSSVLNSVLKTVYKTNLANNLVFALMCEKCGSNGTILQTSHRLQDTHGNKLKWAYPVFRALSTRGLKTECAQYVHPFRTLPITRGYKKNIVSFVSVHIFMAIAAVTKGV